jgi:hypothetical protein
MTDFKDNRRLIYDGHGNLVRNRIESPVKLSRKDLTALEELRELFVKTRSTIEDCTLIQKQFYERLRIVEDKLSAVQNQLIGLQDQVLNRRDHVE